MGRYKHLIFLAAGMVLTLAAYLWFLYSPYFDVFEGWAAGHGVELFVALASIKAVGIVWPPIPGGILTFGSIPVIGWKAAYLSDFLGSMIGSSIAFWIARRWGLRFMRKILDEETLLKVRRVKIAPKHEFEALFLLRLFGGTVVEIVCYAAGILGVSYRNFIFASIISHMVIGIPFYYLGGGLFGEQTWISAFLFICLVALLYKLRKRYFTIEEQL